MLKTSRNTLIILFYLIACVATGGFLYAIPVVSDKAKFLILVALLLHAVLATGLARKWFGIGRVLRPGQAIIAAKIAAGFLIGLAILDIFQKSGTLVGSVLMDGIFLLLGGLWIAVSYFIKQDVKERKICEFC